MENSIFEGNKAALIAHHQELLPLVDGKVGFARNHLVMRGGAVELHRPDGIVRQIHASKAEEAAADLASKIHYDNVSQSFLVMGAGLGYVPKALFRRLFVGSPVAHAMLVWEYDPAMFELAMQTTDLRELLMAPNVKFVIGPQARLDMMFYQLLSRIGGSMQIIKSKWAFESYPAYEEKMQTELLPFIKTCATNIVTVVAFGELLLSNILESLPALARYSGVSVLCDMFKGRPAVLVGGGPSLSKNVQLLRNIEGCAIIICADAALKYLLNLGIHPDFVVSVDPQRGTYIDKYENVRIPTDISLFAHPACSPEIHRNFPGPVFFTGSMMAPFSRFARYFSDAHVIEDDCQCQMHLSFNLAKFLGCDRIALIGQDLSMKLDRKYYAWDADVAPPEVYAEGKDVNGEDVITTPVFVDYLNTYARKIRAYVGKVWQATEGGLAIPGTTTAPLSEVLDDWGSLGEINIKQKVVEASKLATVDRDGLMAEMNAVLRRMMMLRIASLATAKAPEKIAPRMIEYKRDISMLPIPPVTGDKFAKLAVMAGVAEQSLRKALEELKCQQRNS